MVGQWISKLFEIHRPNYRRRWRLGDEPSIVPNKSITGDEGGQWSSSPHWEPILIDKHVHLLFTDFLVESQSQLQIRGFGSFIFAPKFNFGTVLESFSQSKEFPSSANHGGQHFYPAPSCTIKKLPTAPPCMFIFQKYFNLGNNL